MKALSIRQPWAWLIVNGYKDIENRDWRTNFRGRFKVHASKTMTRGDYEACILFCASIGSYLPPSLHIPHFDSLDRGGIVGEAEMIGCTIDSYSPWFVGRFGFELENAKAIEFEPCKGALGFFEP